ncbi:hypothetical protein BC828DRAFT_393484 [Blastocladiella britannica]|nr:hypothetical protein BC828DRAFT_393484 [Blastocladiella britannica]
MWQLISILNQISTYVATQGLEPSPAIQPTFLRYIAISIDVRTRLSEIDVAFSDLLDSRILTQSSYVIVTFTILVAVTGGFLAMFSVYIVRKLTQEARALTTMLYLVPTGLLREAPDLAKFVESGGVMINLNDSA